MKRYLLQISYSGTNFCGWQTQKSGRTVQQTIEQALSEIAKKEIPVTASGRTDAGVHALNQYAHFDFPENMNEKQILKAISTKLPSDIIVNQVLAVKNDFHARFDAFERRYKYILTTKHSPFTFFGKVFYNPEFADDKTIDKSTKAFLGKHDFTSFCKYNPDVKSTFCDIKTFGFHRDNEDLIFEINADRFLHNMVRRLVGTVLNISRFKENPNIIAELIENKNPSHKLLTTFPAKGLYLADVLYPDLTRHTQ